MLVKKNVRTCFSYPLCYKVVRYDVLGLVYISVLSQRELVNFRMKPQAVLSLCSRYAELHSAVAPHGLISVNLTLSVLWRTSRRMRFSWLQTT